MNKIDIETFQFIWEQIENKLIAISKLPKLHCPNGRGQDFKGFDIDSTGVSYNTSTYYYLLLGGTK